MKIKLIVVGKTNNSFIKEGIDEYVNRLKHYVVFEYLEIPDVRKGKKMSEEQQKQEEGGLLLCKTDKSDWIVLLDEKGKEFTSTKFAEFLQKKMNQGLKNLVFIVGGPYGFSEDVYQRANEKIALSKMTFSHEMIRLFFVEQAYRGFTILKGEPYHHS